MRSTGSDAVGRWLVLPALVLAGGLLTWVHRLNADEGQILTGAWNLYSGQRIYEDFFEFIGPASFQWVDLFFGWFGPSYRTAWIASLVMLFVGMAAFLGAAARVVARPPLRVALAVLWLLVATTPPFINHNSYGTFLATVVAWCLLGIVASPRDGDDRRPRSRPGLAATAGAVAGATVFFLQPKGLALFGVGAATLLAVALWPAPDVRSRPRSRAPHGSPGSTEPRAARGSSDRGSRGPAGSRGSAGRLVRLLVPYLVGFGVVLASGVWRWGLAPFTSVLVIARGNVAMNHGALHTDYLPLAAGVALAGLMAVACHREGVLDRRIAFLFLLQAGLWASTAHLPDAWHLAINGFPLVLIMGRLAERSLARGSPRWTRVLAGVFAFVVVLASGVTMVRNAAETRRTGEWLTRLGPVIGDDDFFAFTFLPSLYLELGVPNPYYNSVLYVGSHPESHFERNVALLERHRPRYVIADYSTVEKYGHTFDNPVDEYIRARYRPAHEWRHATGLLEVWERR